MSSRCIFASRFVASNRLTGISAISISYLPTGSVELLRIEKCQVSAPNQRSCTWICGRMGRLADVATPPGTFLAAASTSTITLQDDLASLVDEYTALCHVLVHRTRHGVPKYLTQTALTRC